MKITNGTTKVKYNPKIQPIDKSLLRSKEVTSNA